MKMFVNLLCCFVPFKKARKQIKRKLIGTASRRKRLLAHGCRIEDEIVTTPEGVKIDISNVPHEALGIPKEVFLHKDYGVSFSHDAVLIDIGLNRGIASLFFATYPNIKQIYSFEPFKPTFDLATRNLGLNPDQSKKIHAFNFGLGKAETTLELPYMAKATGGMSTTHDVCKGQKGIWKETVVIKAAAKEITFCGAKPVFVDIDKKTYNMDPELLEGAITPKTKAIIPVHLYGQPADMGGIMEIAQAHNLFVIEDACQAHGAEYKGQRVGSIGDAGCFSFYPGKNLGAYGEAGAVVTNSRELADRIKVLRDHGQEEKYYHSMVGWNARMDGFQGAVLSVKLKRLDQWNESRRRNAELYNSLLADVDEITTPFEADYAKHIYHIYPVLTDNREQLMDALAKEDIYCGIHYPIPLHLQAAYSSLGYKKGDMPVAEKCQSQLVSLPMFPELTCEQIEYAVEKIKSLVCVLQ